jgi:hypothetical protein
MPAIVSMALDVLVWLPIQKDARLLAPPVGLAALAQA